MFQEWNLDKAVLDLVSAGFVISETIEISHDEIEEGYIIKTEPTAGRLVKEGTGIVLYESIGKETFELIRLY